MKPTFAYPVRPWSRCKIDATFLDASYYQSLGRWHKGIDINLVTGGDSDLGYPVQAMFPSTVVFAKNRVSSWGGIVVLRADAEATQHAADMTGIIMDVLDVQYAHLKQVSVQAGDVVRPGDHVGSIGKGSFNQYVAHLHLEMRRTVRDPAEGQGSDDNAKALAKQHYLDPIKMMTALHLTDFGRPYET